MPKTKFTAWALRRKDGILLSGGRGGLVHLWGSRGGARSYSRYIAPLMPEKQAPKVVRVVVTITEQKK